MDDRSSSELMVDFYKGLNEGLTTSRALIVSKRDYLNHADEYTSHPYYWSSFVMLGDDIELGLTNKKYHWVYFILIIAVMVTIATALIVQKKRAN